MRDDPSTPTKVHTITLEDQGISRRTKVGGKCSAMMTRPPKKKLARGTPWQGRTTRRPAGKSWARPCPKSAEVIVDGKRYCKAHAPKRE